MASNITLSAGVRQNLLALQNTASLLGTTQNRLATGKKVNSALDNPSNFFTSVSLQARAGDLSNLLDSMSNGIKNLESADNGLKAITRTVESMQSIVRQARQDKTQSVTPEVVEDITNTSTSTNSSISFDLGGGVSVSVDTYTQTVNATAATLTADSDFSAATAGDEAAFTIDSDSIGAAVSVDLDGTEANIGDVIDTINAALDAVAGGQSIRARANATNANRIEIVDSNGNEITLAGSSTALTNIGFSTAVRVSDNGTPAVAGSAKSLDDLISSINSNAALSGKVKASLDASGDLKLENLTTSAIAITGFDGADFTGDATDVTDLDAGVVATTSNVRQSLSNQFTDLKTQLDRLAEDASFNGINLLAGDKLKLTFNETGSSFLEVQGKNADGTAFGAISTSSLSIDGAYDFSDDSDLDTLTTALSDALTTLRTQASQYGTSLTSVQNRQDFTKAMITTLQTGADSLVLADSNEEAANMLALQTRQQLSSTALSLASQADQQVLRLF